MSEINDFIKQTASLANRSNDGLFRTWRWSKAYLIPETAVQSCSGNKPFRTPVSQGKNVGLCWLEKRKFLLNHFIYTAMSCKVPAFTPLTLRAVFYIMPFSESVFGLQNTYCWHLNTLRRFNSVRHNQFNLHFQGQNQHLSEIVWSNQEALLFFPMMVTPYLRRYWLPQTNFDELRNS